MCASSPPQDTPRRTIMIRTFVRLFLRDVAIFLAGTCTGIAWSLYILT